MANIPYNRSLAFDDFQNSHVGKLVIITKETIVLQRLMPKLAHAERTANKVALFGSTFAHNMASNVYSD